MKNTSLERIQNGLSHVRKWQELDITIPEALTSEVIYTSDGSLFVTKRKCNDLEFLSLSKKMQDRGLKVDIQAVPHEVFFDAFPSGTPIETSAQKNNTELTKLQLTVLEIITQANNLRASDIHFVAQGAKFNVYFRINGDMDPPNSPRHTATFEAGMAMIRGIYQSMVDSSSGEFSTQKGQDASFKRDFLPDGLFGIRLAHTPIFNGHYMVGRLLFSGATAPSFEDLGFEPEQIKTLKWMMKSPYGVILIAGITGSGKTTTIASAIDSIYKSSGGTINIVTVEDPVEIILPAKQIPVTAGEEDTRNQAYQDAVKTMMRMDLDVGMISEIRDISTVEAAIKLAQTGHQAWSTVHAIDVVSILPRLEMMGISRAQLADPKLITGLIAQSLVKELCPKCSLTLDDALKNGSLDQDEHFYLTRLIELNQDALRFKNHSGCHECGKSGYKGRTVIAETVIPDGVFMRHYLGQDYQAMRKHAFDTAGWFSRQKHAVRKLNRGQVDYRDVEQAIGPLVRDLIDSDDVFSFNEIDPA